MRLHNLLTGVTLGAGLLLGVSVSAQSTSGTGGTSEGMSNPSAAGSNQMGTNNPSADTGVAPQTGDVNANHQISGTVSSISNGKIELKSDDGAKLTLRADQDTKIFDKSGNVESFGQLQEGQQIRASYDQLGSENHALRIDVKTDATTK